MPKSRKVSSWFVLLGCVGWTAAVIAFVQVYVQLLRVSTDPPTYSQGFISGRNVARPLRDDSAHDVGSAVARPSVDHQSTGQQSAVFNSPGMDAQGGKAMDLVYRVAEEGWDDADRTCRAEGRRLCRLSEYCQYDAPVAGYVEGDVFAPIADLRGEFVYIGSAFSDRLCRTHTQCCGRLPTWGQRKKGSGNEVLRFLCCKGAASAVVPAVGPAKLPAIAGASAAGTDMVADKKYRETDANWGAAQALCQNDGLRLCTLLEYCPLMVPALGAVEGDWFAPIGETRGEFVALGTQYPDRICLTHTQCCGQLPPWGEMPKVRLHKVLCCKGAPPPSAKQHFVLIPQSGANQGLSDLKYRAMNRKNWAGAKRECEELGRRLCNLAEYCPDGPGVAPALGVIEGDWYGPIGDLEDEFVALGTYFPNRLCGTHTQCCGKKTNLGDQPSRFMRGLCCNGVSQPNPEVNSIKQSEVRKPASLAATVTSDGVDAKYASSYAGWAADKSSCGKRGLRLCHLADYCPKGPLSTPLRGAVEGDLFAPVGDATGEYVSIGTQFPDRMCKLHTQCCGNLPPWGREAGGKESKVLCCREKTSPAQAKAADYEEEQEEEEEEKEMEQVTTTRRGKGRGPSKDRG
mmetsp:Transcript_33377/g.92163  ORF Transcript_33377/g.92163 Transcript_33377/m.92163 type:complete len:628 (-) Transcript_33377:226-2109(-)